MRKFLAVFTALVLLAGTIGTVSALAISTTRAEHAVKQRVKARYIPKSGVVANCHKLTRTRFGCNYQYVAFSGSLCQGGATVRKLGYGISVRLGRPRAVIDNGGC